MAIDNSLAGGVGQAAPAQAKQQTGAAAPASNGTPAGSPSTPSSADAIVAEKKKAEHWQKKYDRDVGSLTERLAKLEGLAQGIQQNAQPAQKGPAKTFADLDDQGLDAIVKKGFEDQNPDFVTASVREIAERIATKKAEEAEGRARQHLEVMQNKQRVAARISSEFGQDAINEESDLRQRADQYIARLVREDPQVMERSPEVVYLCFAQADRELRAGERTDLERLRKAESDRDAREEIERSHQVIATKAKSDVEERLKAKDIKGALRARIPWLQPKT